MKISVLETGKYRSAAVCGAGLGLLVALGSLVIGPIVTSAADPLCSPADVQRRIIANERPNMGALERDFWQRAIATVATTHGVPAEVLTAKIAQESRFRGHVVGSAGEKGASQLMPMHVKGIDPFEIEANLDKGASVLATELKKTKGDVYLALRHYNGGGRAEAMPKTDIYAAKVLARVYVAQQAVCSVKVASR
jgi:soluble lytic murein transglycosylase-like protein